MYSVAIAITSVLTSLSSDLKIQIITNYHLSKTWHSFTYNKSIHTQYFQRSASTMWYAIVKLTLYIIIAGMDKPHTAPVMLAAILPLLLSAHLIHFQPINVWQIRKSTELISSGRQHPNMSSDPCWNSNSSWESLTNNINKKQHWTSFVYSTIDIYFQNKF